MREKKRLSGWQFGLLTGLLVLMLSTMFMPVLQFNGKTLKKMITTLTESVTAAVKDLGAESDYADLDSDDILSLLGINMLDFDENEFDENLKQEEREEGVKISSVSPLRIMTHSLVKFVGGKDATSENPDQILEEVFGDNKSDVQKGYSLIRAAFLSVYTLGLIVLILTIIGFAVGWKKTAIVIINLVYGILSAIVIGIFRFGAMRFLANAFLKPLGSYASFLNVRTFAKPLAHLYSFGAMVAFVTAILLVLMSFLCLFIGGKSSVSTGWEGGMDGSAQWNYHNDIDANRYSEMGMSTDDKYNIFEKSDDNGTVMNISNQDFQLDGQMREYGHTSQTSQAQQTNLREQVITASADQVSSNEVKSVQVVAEGTVRCTKGAAVGQGFRLPADRKVIVGKSPTKANLVVPYNMVSNIHCSIRYNAAHNTYIVKDHSTNGTFVNGVRLQKDIPMEYPAGTVLSLADGANEITLG